MPCIWGWVNGEGGFFEEELLPFITKVSQKLDTQICGAIKLVPAVSYQRHFEAEKQSVSGKTCDRTCVCPHKCQIPSTSEKLPVPTSPSSMPSNMPDRNFVVATAAEVTVTFFFHNSTSSCFILNEKFDILQQQETLFFGYINLGSHVQFQIIRINLSCSEGACTNYPSCINFFRARTEGGC